MPSGDSAGTPYSDVSALSGTLRLSVGLSSRRKALVVTLSVLGFVVLLPIGLLVASALANSSLAVLAVGVPTLLGLLGVALLGVVAWGVCKVVRYGAYLHGTELILRTAFRTRRADLASAQLLRLSMSQDGWSGRALVPTLDVFDDARHRSVTTHFGLARRGFLPHAEVQALTAAIQAGSRAGLPAQHAEHTVRELLRIAY